MFGYHLPSLQPSSFLTFTLYTSILLCDNTSRHSEIHRSEPQAHQSPSSSWRLKTDSSARWQEVRRACSASHVNRTPNNNTTYFYTSVDLDVVFQDRVNIWHGRLGQVLVGALIRLLLEESESMKHGNNQVQLVLSLPGPASPCPTVNSLTP